MRNVAISLLGIFIVISCHGQINRAELPDSFVNRYQTFLLRTTAHDSASYAATEPGSDGRWSDLDYSDDQPSKWQMWDHVKRTRALAYAWAMPESPRYHQPSVIAGIERALDDWGKHRYQNSNWWFNEIGIPQVMRDILCLVGKELSAPAFNDALSVLGQMKVTGTGANLIWSADLGLHYYAFKDNVDSMQYCRDTLLSIVAITTKEGVQPDYSFHQHGARLQVYHYGGAFLKENVRLAWQLRHTSLAFPKEKMTLLSNFLLNGWQWMARGIQTVPGTIDRAASRMHNLTSADVRYLVPFLKQMDPQHATAYQDLLDIQNDKKHLSGYRYFPRADFTAWQKPAFSFFLKTNSNRTLLSESINQENLKGALMDNGDGYFLSNGKEYYDLMPVWNWDLLPGQINFLPLGKRKIMRGEYCGNVSDGTVGAAVMRNRLIAEKDSISETRSWFSFENTLIALTWIDPSSSTADSIVTVLDQCRWQGPVYSSAKNHRLEPGHYVFKNGESIQQHGFRYHPLYNHATELEFGLREGNWYPINHSEPDSIITDSVFQLLMHHGSGASGYVVQYVGVNNRTAANSGFKILRNDSSCQALQFQEKSWCAFFIKSGTLKIKDDLVIEVDRPCSVLFNGTDYYISDPLHRGGNIHITRNHKTIMIDVPNDGTSIKILQF